MPLTHIEKGREKTTLVFDTWAQIDHGALGVHWRVELSDDEYDVLDQLVGRLDYLGRSESWVAGTLLREMPHDDRDAIPCDESPHRGHGWEQVSLLSPLPPQEYVHWRDSAITEALTRIGIDPAIPKLKKSEQKKLASVRSGFPADTIDCLQVQTNWLQAEGWSQPPGSRRVLYWRRRDALDLVPTPRPRPHVAAPVEAMLLSLTTQSGNDHALPAVTRTLPQADLIHRALISRSATDGTHSEVLTGCDTSGTPLKSSHRHAHVLPLDLDADGHIEHVLIWAPMGLDAKAQAAVRSLRHTFTKGGLLPLRVALAASGFPADFSALADVWGKALGALTRPALAWRSVTPFVPPRFMKRRGENTLEGQVAAECASRGLPRPLEIEILDLHRDPSLLTQRHFVRKRKTGPAPPVDHGFALRLRFASPVPGPLALGYGSHFGLGLFSAADG